MTNAVDAIRDILPWWAPFGPLATGLLHALYGAAFVAIVMGRGAHRLRRLPGDAHWTEKVRLIWAAKVDGVVVVAVVAGLLAVNVGRSPFWPGGKATLAAANVVLGLVLCLPLYLCVMRRISTRRWTLARLGALWVCLLGLRSSWLAIAPFAVLVPAQARGIELLFWVLSALVAMTASAFAAVPLLRGMRLLRPAPERVLAIVERVCEAMGVARPRAVRIFGLPAPNAFALPIGRELWFTEEIVEVLDDDELGAICAHELGHLQEPRSVVALRVARMYAWLPLAFWAPILDALGGFGLAGAATLVIVVSVWIQRLGRTLEHRADEHAHALERPTEDGPPALAPEAYARALEVIHRVGELPAVLHAKGTHPHLYDRLLAAGITPPYPRPAAPPRSSMLVTTIAAALTVSLVLGERIGLDEWARRDPEGALVVAAVRGGDADSLASAARSRAGWVRRDPDAVLPLIDAAAELDASHALEAAVLRARAGDCAGAYRRLARVLTHERAIAYLDGLCGGPEEDGATELHE